MKRDRGSGLVIWVILAFLPGCQPIYHYETAEQVTLKTNVSYDSLKKLTTIHGPIADAPQKSLRYFLSATYRENNFLSYDLVVVQHRGHTQGPAYYKEASDSSGNKFTISRESYQSGGNEYFGIPIPRNYLLDRQDKGLAFQLYGSRDETALTVAPFYIKGFLKKVKESGFPI